MADGIARRTHGTWGPVHRVDSLPRATGRTGAKKARTDNGPKGPSAHGRETPATERGDAGVDDPTRHVGIPVQGIRSDQPYVPGLRPFLKSISAGLATGPAAVSSGSAETCQAPWPR